MGLTHFDEAPAHEFEVGHIRGRWTMLGEGAGSVEIGIRRIQVPAGGWTTPAHDHGREEELFYVLGGAGIVWHGGATFPVTEGDCIVFHPRRGAHTVHATEGLDLLAFGPRESDEAPHFPRLEMTLLGRAMVQVTPGVIERAPAQFVHEAHLGPPEVPATPGDRPPTVANRAEVTPVGFGRGRVSSERRKLGQAVGSRVCGLQHVTVEPGCPATPAHCHSTEEELFVVLDGGGELRLVGEGNYAVRAGHVIARPAGTGVSHQFIAGPSGLVFLAYGQRKPGDMCFYPDSNKIAFRGLGVIGRVEHLDYWDGEA